MRSFDLLCQSKCCDGCCKKGSQLKGRCADAGDIAQVKLPNITINKTIGDEGITVDFRFIKVHTSN